MAPQGERKRVVSKTMHSLPVFLRLAGRPVMLIGPEHAVAPKRRLLERAGARIVGEADAAVIAIVALDDDAEAAATVARLRTRGVLVNAVDRPALCDFTLPAIVDRAPVLIAVGTGGASAGLAKAVRQRIEALLPARLGALADALHGARERLRERFPDAADRRTAIDAALAPGGALDPLRPFAGLGDWPADVEAAAARIERVAIRAPDPDELTLRAARLLGQADAVRHPADMPAAILDRARADAIRTADPARSLTGLVVELAWTDDARRL